MRRGGVTCDLCGEREAMVHLTEIINDETRELHLCEPCAQEKGTGAASQFGLAELLAGLANFGAVREEGETKPKVACPRCKMTYEDFRKSGRLGCGDCYETFHRFLSPLLKRIHGSTHHVGKSPVRVSEKAVSAGDDLAKLKESLRQAVAAEQFEEAARLRDRVRALEAKKGREAKEAKEGKEGRAGK